MAPTTVVRNDSIPAIKSGEMSNDYATDANPIIDTGLSVVQSCVITTATATGVELTPIILTTLPSAGGQVEIELITEAGNALATGTEAVYFIAGGVA